MNDCGENLNFKLWKMEYKVKNIYKCKCYNDDSIVLQNSDDTIKSAFLNASSENK